MLTNGKIPPLTGGIRTLEKLADSTDAEDEEDRPEKQFLRKLQWMWEYQKTKKPWNRSSKVLSVPPQGFEPWTR